MTFKCECSLELLNYDQIISDYRRIGGGLSSISLSIEKAPTGSNSVYTIYPGSLYLHAVSIFYDTVLFPCTRVNS